MLNAMTRLLAAMLLVLLLCSGALAASSVWKAQKGGRTIYLGGTCHLLREGDYPLPEEFDRAYAAADTLVFETDLDRLADPELQGKLLARGSYADGSTVEKHLSPAVYGKLRAHCEKNGIPLELFARLKPSLLMVTLTMLELSRQGVTGEGVDRYFQGRAKRDGKRVEALETVDEQLGYVVSLADGVEDAFVSQSLADLEGVGARFDEMTGAWRRGDGAAIEALMNGELKSRYPALFERLISARNRKWLPRIDAPGTGGKAPFVLVGAGHLVGPEGLLAELAKRGYRIDKL